MPRKIIDKILNREPRLNKIKFGIAGGLTTSVFVLFVEIFSWIKLVPLYNTFMINLYGASDLNVFYLLLMSFLFLILGFIFGFVLTYLFAWVYNKLLLVKVK